MKTVRVTLLAVLLLALELSSRVALVQTATTPSIDTTVPSTTLLPAPAPNSTVNATQSVNPTSGDKNTAERSEGLALLLLPLALGASLLHGWSL